MTDSIPRLFGTDGVRLVVGEELTTGLVADLAAASAGLLGERGTVLIAQDFRTTSPGIARVLAGVLSMDGVEVVELGTMPTPALQFNVKALRADLGLMVTASHNPTEFNGIKFCGPLGVELDRDAERAIETRVARREFPRVPWERAGAIRSDTSGVDRYLASIRAVVDVPKIRERRLKVVLDCGNGTSAVTSPRLLRELGCQVTTLNANGDGHFPGHPSEPKEENLGDLKRAVTEFGADLGLAHDGDSDRVAFVDERGRYVPGEETLALFARETLRRLGAGPVVTSVTSTRAVEEAVAREGGKLVVTRSGSLPVALGMLESHALFGGEENGGYYWPLHQVARDGPASSAHLLEILARSRETLSGLLESLPKYHVRKRNVPLPKALRPAVMAQVEAELSSGAERLLTLDGVKAFYPEGWLLVRPSGTEPLCRLFAESREAERADALLEGGVRLVERLRDEAGRNSSPPTRP